jgi:hypothetical protein
VFGIAIFPSPGDNKYCIRLSRKAASKQCDGLKFPLVSIQLNETLGLVTIDHLLDGQPCIMAR